MHLYIYLVSLSLYIYIFVEYYFIWYKCNVKVGGIGTLVCMGCDAGAADAHLLLF